MIKVIIILLSIALGCITAFLGFNNFELIYKVLIAIAFSILFIIGIAVLFFIILFILTIGESKNKEREKQSKFYRRVLLFYNKFLFSLFTMKIEYSGIEKMDGIEQALIISNHRSNLDSLVIDNYLKDYPLVFVAKKSLFKIPFVGRLIHGCNYICLDRKNLKQELLAIRKGINILNDKNENCSVGVFPEGTRTLNEDYSLAEFRPGCFNLAKKSHVPIVIFALKNTDKVNNGLLIKIHHIKCHLIKVLYYDDYKDLNTIELANLSKEIIQQYLKEEIWYEIRSF